MLAEAAFCISAAAGIYHHAVYPFLLRSLTAGKSATAPKCPPPDELPSLTVIVPAHNEEAFIACKIENLAALDYPREKLAIAIACDGCTDRTVEIAKEAASRVRDTAIEVSGLRGQHWQGGHIKQSNSPISYRHCCVERRVRDSAQGRAFESRRAFGGWDRGRCLRDL